MKMKLKTTLVFICESIVAILLVAFLERHRITHVELVDQKNWGDIIYTKPVDEWLTGTDWKTMI